MPFDPPSKAVADRIFSHAETARLLDTLRAALAKTSESRCDYFLAYRDLTIIELALTTGLREHEITALDLGDFFAAGSAEIQPLVTLRVYKGHKRGKRPARRQRVALSEAMRERLAGLFALMRADGHDASDGAPAFVSRNRRRLSTRMVRHAFGAWCAAAGLPGGRGFHSLRHTACTRLAKATKDVVRVRDFARHADIRTTSIYLHTTDEELCDAAERLTARAANPSDPIASMIGAALDPASARALLAELLNVLARHATANTGTDRTAFGA